MTVIFISTRFVRVSSRAENDNELGRIFTSSSKNRVELSRCTFRNQCNVSSWYAHCFLCDPFVGDHISWDLVVDDVSLHYAQYHIFLLVVQMKRAVDNSREKTLQPSIQGPCEDESDFFSLHYRRGRVNAAVFESPEEKLRHVLWHIFRLDK